MKRQTIIALGFLFCSMLQAQDKQQYLHITVGGGLHDLSYNLQNGTQSGRFGNTINAGYSYFFTQHWGIQSGLGLQWFNARSTMSYQLAIPKVDTDGENYEFRTNYNNWQEKQQALFMDIPLTLQYRHALSNKISLQGSAGGKVSFPISSSYKTTNGEITTTGYFPRLNAELSDLPEYGFTTTTNSYNGKLALHPSYMAIADVGGLYTLSPKVDLYLGAYINYGLNNALKADTKELYQLDGVYNGVLASTQVTKVNPVSIGVKIGIYFRMAKTREIAITDELPVITKSAEVAQVTDTVIVPLNVKSPVAITEKPIIIVPDSIQKEKVLEQPKQIASSINITFPLNSDQSKNVEGDKTKTLSDMLKANHGICLHIIGHACDLGTNSFNLQLGEKRAIAVKQQFVLQGVPAAQLTTESKGSTEPLVPNTSTANRKKNRRVEIKVVNCQ